MGTHQDQRLLYLPLRRVVGEPLVIPHRYPAGSFHESFGHSRYIWLKSNRGLRASRSDGARSWHQRPWRAQPRARRAAWALLARPEHVSSLAASSADDHLTVGGDANVVVGADPEHAACTSLRDPV